MTDGKTKYLLITGDLTEFGDEESAIAVANILHEVEDKKLKAFVINGNHDVRTSEASEKMTQARFKEIFRDFGYGEALETYEGTLSYVADLDDEHRLIAVDDIAYYADDGRKKEMLDEKHRLWIYDKIDECNAAGKTPVVIAHIPFMGHFPKLYEVIAGEDSLQFNKLIDYFARNGVQYSFVGHMHVNDVKEKVVATEEGNLVYNEVMTGCLPMYGTTYREMVWGKEDTTIRTVRMEEVNDKYLPPFTTEEEENALEDNMSQHARAYLYNYIVAYITSALAEGGMADIHVEGENAEVIDAMIDVIRTDVLQKIWATPYTKKEETSGGTSIERILESYGLPMFATKYNTLADFAIDCVCVLVDGNENFDSAEFRGTVKNVVFEVFYFLQQAEGKLNVLAEQAGMTARLSLNTEKLYKEGVLECYESGLVPFFVEVLQLTGYGFLQNDLVRGALNSLKADLSIAKNEIVLESIDAVTDDAVKGFDTYVSDKEIALADLLEKGFIEQYISDFVTDTPPNDWEIVIHK